jgi:hypothetical protein
MCGSSDLNERMRAFALSDLRDQEYLAATGTIEAAVDDYIMPKFETKQQELLHQLILTVSSKWILACLSLQIVWYRLNLPAMPAFSPLLKHKSVSLTVSIHVTHMRRWRVC